MLPFIVGILMALLIYVLGYWTGYWFGDDRSKEERYMSKAHIAIIRSSNERIDQQEATIRTLRRELSRTNRVIATMTTEKELA